MDRHLNTEYMNLGLDDDVIDLLRERKINTRLLCDLILNPNFTDFMADIEIYINGLISMRITALNTQLQAARTLLKHKRNIQEEDINMRTMLLGQFDETRYFCTIIGEDIDKILYSLRERYKENKKDNTVTSSDVDLGEMAVKAVEQYQDLKGITAEKQVEFLSSFTGRKAEKMTEDDKKAHGSFLKMLSKFWKKL